MLHDDSELHKICCSSETVKRPVRMCFHSHPVLSRHEKCFLVVIHEHPDGLVLPLHPRRELEGGGSSGSRELGRVVVVRRRHHDRGRGLRPAIEAAIGRIFLYFDGQSDGLDTAAAESPAPAVIHVCDVRRSGRRRRRHGLIGSYSGGHLNNCSNYLEITRSRLLRLACFKIDFLFFPLAIKLRSRSSSHNVLVQ